MDFDDLKAHLDRLFAARPSGSSREQAAGLRSALVEFKAALGELRGALARTERELEAGRRDLADTERRAGLARDIGDAETVRVAEEHAARMRTRVDLLERKVLVQRDEVDLAEREYEALHAQARRATLGLPPDAPVPPPAAGDADPTSPPHDPLLDRRAQEAAVEAQLAHLKKQLGKDRP